MSVSSSKYFADIDPVELVLPIDHFVNVSARKKLTVVNCKVTWNVSLPNTVGFNYMAVT
ncbi:protein of unknown function (plasmid) [Caballeronia sp. S22]